MADTLNEKIRRIDLASGGNGENSSLKEVTTWLDGHLKSDIISQQKGETTVLSQPNDCCVKLSSDN